MKDCVPPLCLAITMTPRRNRVKSSTILAVVEMPTTSSLKWIATMSVEKVRGFWFRFGYFLCCVLVVFFLFCQSEAVKALHIPVTSVHSVLLLTLACYRGMLFAFWTLRFSRAGKIEMPC